MAKNPETLVGHLIDVHGGEWTATLVEDAQGGPPTVTIGDEDILVGQIGSYLCVTQEGLRAVTMVTRMTEQEALATQVIDAKEEAPARLPFAKRVARLTPIGTLTKEGLFARGVTQYPTTGAEVHALGSSEIKKMFDRFQSKNFAVGSVATNPKLRVCLDPTGLFGRHVAILGQTGSGKSWTVASLIQKTVAVMPRAHIILLDLHGEYCWKDASEKKRYAFDEKIVRHIDARELEMPYWLMTYAELCDLLIDRTETAAHNQIAFFRDTLRELREAEGAALKLDRVTVDTPVFFSLPELIRRVEEENSRMVPGERGPKKGPNHGDFDRFLMRLQSRMNDVRYDFLLKPRVRSKSSTLVDLLRDFVGLGTPKRPVTIIDLSSVPFDVRPTVAAQIGRLAFEFNYWNPQYREFPILLVCEEAHAYIPRAQETQFAGSRKSMERIAKEGRKYGVGLAVVSQRPHELSDTVLAQCGTFLCLRLTNPDDQAYVRSLVPESEGDLTSVLASLARGEALALGEAVPMPTRVKFDVPTPKPNSEDVDFYEKWKSGPEEIPVEDIVRRWWRQERQ